MEVQRHFTISSLCDKWRNILLFSKKGEPNDWSLDFDYTPRHMFLKSTHDISFCFCFFFIWKQKKNGVDASKKSKKCIKFGFLKCHNESFKPSQSNKFVDSEKHRWMLKHMDYRLNSASRKKKDHFALLLFRSSGLGSTLFLSSATIIVFFLCALPSLCDTVQPQKLCGFPQVERLYESNY